jgi:hypothetical protein
MGSMHAVSADQVTEMVDLGCDERVLTSDIGLLRALPAPTSGTRAA